MSPERPSSSGKRPRKPSSTSKGSRGSSRSSSRGSSRAAGGNEPRSLRRRIATGVGLAALAAGLLGVIAFVVGYLVTDIPDPNDDFTAETTFVYYANGSSEIGTFADQNRTSVPLAEVPQHVRDAVIAAEDQSFYTNRGIDPKGIVRAAFSNARGNATQGASTITQQYVKIFYLSSDRTLTRKVKEAFVSLKLQRQQSKDEILQGYLNTIYFGRGAYGIQAAAQAYFDKDAENLTVREGAVLASVLNSPSALDPAEGREARADLLGRYQYVLNGMEEAGDLTPEQRDSAYDRLPRFPRIPSSNRYGGQKGHVLTLVRKQLLASGFTEEEISGGGLKVTTTFTRKAMGAAARAVRDQAPKGLKGLHVAVASVDPRSGALRGMYAGQDYLRSQINWAVAGSSPGSTFKPFALAAGIQDGYALTSTFDGNSPYVWPDGTTTIVNEGPGDGNDYGSAINLVTASEQSVNTAYVDLTAAMQDGPRKIVDTAVRMGIPRRAPGLEPNPSVALGSATISPIDMANAYGTIAAGGRAKRWSAIARVEDATGRVRYRAPADRPRAIPQAVSDDVGFALQQVVQAGTGQNALGLGRPAGGKTGTATNEDGNVSSSWFVGYTPQLSTAVMYVRGDGNDNLNCVAARGPNCVPGYLVPYFGATYPTLTWAQVMGGALEGAPVLGLPPAANVPARKADHQPVPTFTPEPEPEPTPSESPRESPSGSAGEDPSPTQSGSPSGSPSQSRSPGEERSRAGGDGQQ